MHTAPKQVLHIGSDTNIYSHDVIVLYFQSNRQYNSFNSQHQREEEKGNMRVYR
jgi:hypothetical protein